MKRALALTLAAMHVTVHAAAVEQGALTADRVWAAATTVLALVGVVVGWRALARSTGRSASGNGRRGAIIALGAGHIAVISGGLVLATADGGPGTGNGVVGAAVAMGLGVIGGVLGWMTLARTRREA